MHSSDSSRDVYRILIVDDAATVRESLSWLLQNEPGLTVVGDASTGSDAIQQTVKLRPDLVLLDIELPDMDGFSVTRQLKALPNPSLVVLLSIHNDSLSRERGFNSGCDAYVGKEVGWERLLAILQNVLADRNLNK
jgi:DNA-binding NarL/FixJ family response regulator